MGKPKPQASFRLLLVEVLQRESFSKKKGEVTKLDSICKVTRGGYFTSTRPLASLCFGSSCRVSLLFLRLLACRF